jgi:hypothetical protein
LILILRSAGDDAGDLLAQASFFGSDHLRSPPPAALKAAFKLFSDRLALVSFFPRSLSRPC